MTKQIAYLTGLITCIAGAMLGQAELIGEPWRHYVTLTFIVGTAATAYLMNPPSPLNRGQAMDWKSLLGVLVPIVLGSINRVPKSLIPAIQDGIAHAESLPGASGPEKKAHVMSIVTDVLAAGHAVKPGANLKDADVLEAVSNGIDAAVSVVNITHAAQ